MAATPNPYSFMHTLGIGGKTIVAFDDQSSIDVSFAAAEVLKTGTIVKMNGDMTVAAVTAVTDVPVGIVVNGEQKPDGSFTTVVKLQALQIVKGLASGILAAGGIVDAEAFDGTAELMKYKAHVATNYAVGVVLVGGADTEEVLIAIHRTFGIG